MDSDYKALFIETLIQELNVISRKDFSPRPDPMASTPSLGVQESGKNLSNNPQSLQVMVSLLFTNLFLEILRLRLFYLCFLF